ncbi:Arginine metabolism regulation II [Fusarium albosuccineum]|uniref:Arginine metabolism regulation II n=1 Tax=Fusarium albosuccineum TaxID=1237068 RepID=A0A8H4P0P9_9HYPO|nr:Arginine metabolism regulation II [Fusarium albosuccineum]
MPADEPRSDADSGQARKSRTKSFSGCWTCRAKHVKCDETRPACTRCQRSGLTCEGYGVRLSWTSVRNPSTFRSRTPSKRKAAKRATSRLLHTRRLSSIDESQSSHDSPAANSEENQEAGESSNSALQSQPVSPPDQNPHSLIEAEPFDGGLNSRIFHSHELLGQGLATRVSYVPLQQAPQQLLLEQPRNWEQGVTTPDSNIAVNNPTPISLGDIGLGTWTLLVFLSPPPLHYPYRAARDMRRAFIMGSQPLEAGVTWISSLIRALIPGIHNPMRTAMMPIALEGSRTDSKKATGATALFHLICSASAFHLSQKRSTPESKSALENVALEHHNIGITHLAQNIRSDDRKQCVSLLASVVMCIMNEAITLPTQFWRLHFRGAVEWVNHIEPQVWRQNEAASAVYQMFIGMATLVQAQLLFDGHETSFWHFEYDPASQPKPYALYMSFGLPQPLLQGIHSMNNLQMRKKFSNGRPTDHENAPSRQVLDRLELELYLCAPSKSDAFESKEYGDLIYHHGCTFYYAALIHMKRTLKEMPVADVQSLVEQSMPHLEALQICTTQRFSPMVWPVAIIAFEIRHVELQHRMLKCLNFFLDRSDLAIWSQITNLARDLWALRKTQDPNLKWYQTSSGSMSDNFMLL